MKFVKRPVVIEAITFDELVAHGLTNCECPVNGMPWAFSYNGHPITHENDDCYLIPTLEGTMRFERGDMLITGIKGEIYPCKRDIFEATYEAVGEDAPGIYQGMNFGDALVMLKQGKRVARSGWNGKGMWLSLSSGPLTSRDNGAREITADKFWSRNNADYAVACGGSAKVLPCITMKTATGEILMGWLASQTDMLADDWQVVE